MFVDQFLGEKDQQNRRQGFGLQTYGNGSLYLGERQQDLKEGRGTFVGSQGELYEGEFSRDCFHGVGYQLEKDGRSYVGQFQLGKRDGVGRLVDANNEFIGGFRKGKRNGVGMQRSLDKDRVVKGEYSDGFLNGFVIIKVLSQRYMYTGYAIESSLQGLAEEIQNDSVYIGQFFQSKKHGTGYIKSRDGLSYMGDWKDGERTGFGIEQLNTGEYYEGEFLNESKQGAGRYVTPKTGVIYTGDFLQSLPHGFGQAKSNTFFYIGDWKNGKRNGLGYQKHADGKIYFGLWKNDKREGMGYTLDTQVEYKGYFVEDMPHGVGIIRLDSKDPIAAQFSHGKFVEARKEPISVVMRLFDALNFQDFESKALAEISNTIEFVDRNTDETLRQYFSFDFDFRTKEIQLNDKLLETADQMADVAKRVNRIRKYLFDETISSKLPIKQSLAIHMDNLKKRKIEEEEQKRSPLLKMNPTTQIDSFKDEPKNNVFSKLDEYLQKNEVFDLDNITVVLKDDTSAINYNEDAMSKMSQKIKQGGSRRESNPYTGFVDLPTDRRDRSQKELNEGGDLDRTRLIKLENTISQGRNKSRGSIHSENWPDNQDRDFDRENTIVHSRGRLVSEGNKMAYRVSMAQRDDLEDIPDDDSEMDRLNKDFDAVRNGGKVEQLSAGQQTPRENQESPKSSEGGVEMTEHHIKMRREDTRGEIRGEARNETPNFKQLDDENTLNVDQKNTLTPQEDTFNMIANKSDFNESKLLNLQNEHYKDGSINYDEPIIDESMLNKMENSQHQELVDIKAMIDTRRDSKRNLESIPEIYDEISANVDRRESNLTKKNVYHSPDDAILKGSDSERVESTPKGSHRTEVHLPLLPEDQMRQVEFFRPLYPNILEPENTQRERASSRPISEEGARSNTVNDINGFLQEVYLEHNEQDSPDFGGNLLKRRKPSHHSVVSKDGIPILQRQSSNRTEEFINIQPMETVGMTEVTPEWGPRTLQKQRTNKTIEFVNVQPLETYALTEKTPPNQFQRKPTHKTIDNIGLMPEEADFLEEHHRMINALVETQSMGTEQDVYGFLNGVYNSIEDKQSRRTSVQKDTLITPDKPLRAKDSWLDEKQAKDLPAQESKDEVRTVKTVTELLVNPTEGFAEMDKSQRVYQIPGEKSPVVTKLQKVEAIESKFQSNNPSELSDVKSFLGKVYDEDRPLSERVSHQVVGPQDKPFVSLNKDESKPQNVDQYKPPPRVSQKTVSVVNIVPHEGSGRMEGAIKHLPQILPRAVANTYPEMDAISTFSDSHINKIMGDSRLNELAERSMEQSAPIDSPRSTLQGKSFIKKRTSVRTETDMVVSPEDMEQHWEKISNKDVNRQMVEKGYRTTEVQSIRIEEKNSVKEHTVKTISELCIDPATGQVINEARSVHNSHHQTIQPNPSPIIVPPVEATAIEEKAGWRKNSGATKSEIGIGPADGNATMEQKKIEVLVEKSFQRKETTKTVTEIGMEPHEVAQTTDQFKIKREENQIQVSPPRKNSSFTKKTISEIGVEPVQAHMNVDKSESKLQKPEGDLDLKINLSSLKLNQRRTDSKTDDIPQSSSRTMDKTNQLLESTERTLGSKSPRDPVSQNNGSRPPTDRGLLSSRLDESTALQTSQVLMPNLRRKDMPVDQKSTPEPALAEVSKALNPPRRRETADDSGQSPDPPLLPPSQNPFLMKDKGSSGEKVEDNKIKLAGNAFIHKEMERKKEVQKTEKKEDNNTLFKKDTDNPFIKASMERMKEVEDRKKKEQKEKSLSPAIKDNPFFKTNNK